MYPQPDPAALDTEWAAAKERLGGPIANAGHPDVRPIPAPYDAHVQQLITTPWCAPAFAGRFRRGCEFKLVELDPLLEHQFTVSTSRALNHSAELAKPPTMQQMLDLCLPLQQSKATFQTFESPNGMMIKSDSLELRALGGGVFNASFLGMQFGLSLPFMQVACHNNRYHLSNGLHRAVCLRIMGATHAPCIVRNLSTYEQVGASRPMGAPLITRSWSLS